MASRWSPPWRAPCPSRWRPTPRRAPPARGAPRRGRAAASIGLPRPAAPACRPPPWLRGRWHASVLLASRFPISVRPRSSIFRCSSDGSHHQVVARDHRIVAAPAEDRVDLLAVTAGQLAAGVGGIVDEAAPVHAAAAVADLDDVALVERPLDA